MTGVPLMSGIYTVSRIQLLPSPPDAGQQMVEVKITRSLPHSVKLNGRDCLKGNESFQTKGYEEYAEYAHC